MCGRTACTLSAARMRHVGNISSQRVAAASAAATGAAAAAPAGEKSASAEAPLTGVVYRKFNISPTGVLPIVVERGAAGERQLLLAEWGLRPPAHHLPSDRAAAKPAAFPYSSFNARVEGLTTSKLYNRLLNSRRCVLVVDGFYEWKKDPKDPKKRQPFFIRMPSAFRETPIPLRKDKIAEERQQGSTSSFSLKGSTKTEQQGHPSHSQARQPAIAAAADDGGEQQQQQGSALSPAAGKRRRGSADVRSEPSSSGSSSTAEEEAGGSSRPGEGLSGKAEAAAAGQREKRKLEEGKEAEDGEEAGTLHPEEAPLLLAGLYDFLYTAAAVEEGSSSSTEKSERGSSSGSSGVSCSVTILTMSSTGTRLQDLHSRIPVALSPEAAALWLDCVSVPFEACIEKITSGSTALYRDNIFFYPVTPRVGNSRYEAPDCTEPLGVKAEAGAAAAEKKKQQFLFFPAQRGGEGKRPRHAEGAEQQTKREREQVLEPEQQQQQQQQVKQEKHGLSHQQQQRAEKAAQKEEREHGGSKDETKRIAATATARGAHAAGMKSMDHYFKRAAPKKQSQ